MLDDRVLPTGAFAGFANELEHLGLDQPDATLPALTGDRDTDWAAFSAVYQKVTGQLHASTGVRQDLAAATITGMLAALDDNHVEWNYPAAPPPGYGPGKGYGRLRRPPCAAPSPGSGGGAQGVSRAVMPCVAAGDRVVQAHGNPPGPFRDQHRASAFLPVPRHLQPLARRISASNLNERLSLRGPDDELKALGDTLDDLFARLESAFQAQRHFVANASWEVSRAR